MPSGGRWSEGEDSDPGPRFDRRARALVLAIGGGPISCYMRPLVCAGLESNRRRADAHEIGPRCPRSRACGLPIPASLVPSGPASGARLLPAAWAFPARQIPTGVPSVPC